MKKYVIWFGAFMMLAASGNSLKATPLPPGGDVVPATSAPGFTPIVSLPQAFSFAGNTGFVTEEAGTSPGNPFGASDAAFLYQVSVTTGQIQNLTNISFKGYMVDVAQGPLGMPGPFGPGSTPSSDANRAVDGSTVSWNFSSPVVAGMASTILMVSTDAPSFDASTLGLIDVAGNKATLNGFQPTPEPASFVLFAGSFLGMGGLAAWRRRLA